MIHLDADQIVAGALEYRVLAGGDFAPHDQVVCYRAEVPAQEVRFFACFVSEGRQPTADETSSPGEVIA